MNGATREPEKSALSSALPAPYILRGVTLKQLWICWWHGFYPGRALEYDFERYRPEDYFPDLSEGAPGRTIEPGEVECCRDKLFFALLME